MNSTHAYVLVQTHSEIHGIAGALRNVPGVLLAEDLQGPYDAIALARSDSAKLPVEGVIAEIRDVPGVARALPIPLRHSFAEAREGEAA